MQRFFLDFESLDRFTFSLRCFDDKLQCPHCTQSHHLISHGVIYKQRSMTQRDAVGKRVFCSNRSQRSGCGRTVQLYVAAVMPTMQYAVAALFAFLSALFKKVSVVTAYQMATGQTNARHAWRWLNKLHGRLTDFRTFVHNRSEPVLSTFKTSSRRLQVLLPTLSSLFALSPDAPCAHYQLLSQKPLL